MLISKDYAILFLFAFLFTSIIIFIVASNIYANSPPLQNQLANNKLMNNKTQ